MKVFDELFVVRGEAQSGPHVAVPRSGTCGNNRRFKRSRCQNLSRSAHVSAGKCVLKKRQLRTASPSDREGSFLAGCGCPHPLRPSISFGLNVLTADAKGGSEQSLRAPSGALENSQQEHQGIQARQVRNENSPAGTAGVCVPQNNQSRQGRAEIQRRDPNPALELTVSNPPLY